MWVGWLLDAVKLAIDHISGDEAGSEMRGPNGIRIRVCGLKGRRPSPLDDGAMKGC